MCLCAGVKVKEKEKKTKDKYGHESGREKGKEKERNKEHEKDRKRTSSEKDRESDRDSSGSWSRKKSSSSSSSRDKYKEKDSRRNKERERERGGKEHASSGSRDSKHLPSDLKFHRSVSSSSSSKGRMRSSGRRSHSRSPPMIPAGRRSRSRSPVLHTTSRIVEIASSRPTAVPTGKGSIQTTKGFVSSFPPAIPPFGSREIRNRSPSPPEDDLSYRFFGRRNSKSGQY